MKQIGSYVNGNTIVVLYDDGTKERYIRAGEAPHPEFPESIDIKITNKCDAECPMCAECSSPNGRHANLNNPLLSSVHAYTELAIGGGNPLAHPGLYEFLKQMAEKNVVCNLTVNQKHFMENIGFLRMLSDKGLIYGLGVSVPNEPEYGLIDKLKLFPNAVVHTIAGYTPIKTYKKLALHDIKLLILGYKNKGLGKALMLDGTTFIDKQREELQHYLESGGYNCFNAVAFDNLAVQQLDCKSWMPSDTFDKFYMGDDGEFTMYIDLVTGEYAKSSTHHPKPIDSQTISELFTKV